jgi:hypothetical protein
VLNFREKPAGGIPMPYILKEKRTLLDPAIEKLAGTIRELNDDANFGGNLNYVVSKLLKILHAAPNYQRFNDMIGALECCKLELYRKRIAPYEELKERENGPI